MLAPGREPSGLVLGLAERIGDPMRGIVDPPALEKPPGIDRDLDAERELHNEEYTTPAPKGHYVKIVF